MSWAARRRFFILLIIGIVAAAFFVIVLIATAYKTPSCSDGVQNQDEQGVDCGGSCSYLCTALQEPPTVLFTQVLGNGAGRADIVAMVRNKNASAAARNVPYRVMLYGEGHVFVKEVDGTIDLPPGATVPVFLPGVGAGKQKVLSAFLSIDAPSIRWVPLPTDPRVIPTVSNITHNVDANAPRVSATLTNPSATTLSDLRVIVLVSDFRRNVIAASETIVPLVAGQGQATAVFTWNGAFSGQPASVLVIPVVPLPT